MSDEQIFKELANYKKVLEEKGYKVIYIGLFGSQNYNLNDSISDIDAKAIILPSLHDIIFRNITSKTIELANGSIDVKDIITFYDVSDLLPPLSDTSLEVGASYSRYLLISA